MGDGCGFSDSRLVALDTGGDDPSCGSSGACEGERFSRVPGPVRPGVPALLHRVPDVGRGLAEAMPGCLLVGRGPFAPHPCEGPRTLLRSTSGHRQVGVVLLLIGPIKPIGARGLRDFGSGIVVSGRGTVPFAGSLAFPHRAEHLGLFWNDEGGLSFRL